MRMLLVCIVLLSAGSLRAAEPHTPKELIGVWVLESVRTQGQDVPAEKIPYDFHFTETQLIWRFTGQVTGPDRVYNCFANPAKQSGKVDFVLVNEAAKEDEESLHIRAIYRLDGETLLICSMRRPDMEPSENRPEKFESTKDARTDLMTLKRKSDSKTKPVSN